MKENSLYDRLITLLDQHGAKYRLIDHKPEGRTEIVSPMRGNKLSQAAKCMVLAVQIGKKETKYVLGVIPGDKKIDFDSVKMLMHASYVSFAPAQIAEELSGSVVGTVLPISFNSQLELIVDPLLLENDELFFNAARLDRSMALKTKDYIAIVKPRVVSIAKNDEVQKHKIQDTESLDHLRHSCAHLLAAAVMELWPDTKRTIGPSIKNGFYYDFDFQHPISETDLKLIEKKMASILIYWKGFERKEISKDDAFKAFENNEYKKELIEEFSSEGQTLTLYTSGKYTDLCRGGHVENPSKNLQHFRLLSIAGAYWRGSEKNKMLTRIYGTCFPTKKELEQYLWQQEEAKKRDHRKLGHELKLFMLKPEIGSGFPIYLPKGYLLRESLERWIIEEKKKRGYQFVWTPHIAKSDLYKKSGHWQKYEAMFNPMKLDDEEYVAKPMNCPHHFQVYLDTPRSYRDLPLRIAENATVYRFEKAGELNGLLRVRALTQDDTHTFVRESQITEEIAKVLELTLHIFKTFNFTKVKARISTSDKSHPEKYLGDKNSWIKAEEALEKSLKNGELEYFIGEGEAAFYGPKIDIIVNDALGREWQLTTVQLDFNQPVNFDMKYTNEEGKEERPAVLHIAIFGSFDRFIAILIEHYAGKFPLWLAPVQLKIIPIADRHVDAANTIKTALSMGGIRVEIDDRNESMQSKIRDATLQKVPFMGIIGDKEIENSTGLSQKITVRGREGENLGQLTIEQLLSKFKTDIEKKL